jgi:hypothetical protein
MSGRLRDLKFFTASVTPVAVVNRPVPPLMVMASEVDGCRRREGTGTDAGGVQQIAVGCGEGVLGFLLQRHQVGERNRVQSCPAEVKERARSDRGRRMKVSTPTPTLHMMSLW